MNMKKWYPPTLGWRWSDLVYYDVVVSVAAIVVVVVKNTSAKRRIKIVWIFVYG